MRKASVLVRAMSIDDYPVVIELWRRTEGIGLNEADAEGATEAYLRRNPNMSAVAHLASGELVGAVLCGHDGRRGYLHHLAVEGTHRRKGIAAQLIAWCLDRLGEAGLAKCNVFLFSDNEAGDSFWRHNGWSSRVDLCVFQKPIRPAT